MKIDRIEKPVEFTPIIVTMMIETQEELNALQALSGYENTHTDVLHDYGSLEEQYKPVVRKFFSTLYDKII